MIAFVLSELWIWLAILLSCYLILPVVLIYLTYRMELPSHLRPIVDMSALPPETRHYFYNAYEALSPMGFQLLGTFFMNEMIKNVEVYMVLYRNQSTLTSSLIVCAYLTSQGARRCVESNAQFLTSFPNNQRVCTTSQKTLGSFKIPPNHLTTFHPKIQDPKKLYAAHQAICRNRFRSQSAIDRLTPEMIQQPDEIVMKSVEEELTQAVHDGYLKRIEGDLPESSSPVGYQSPYAPPTIATCTSFRPTLWGALRMTWKQLWPIKQVIVFFRDRHSRKILQSAGFSNNP